MNKDYLKKELKQDLIDVQDGKPITPILEKLMELLVCDRCFGKGYGTQTLFMQEGMPDFGPDDGKRFKTKLATMVFCGCSRGKQLMKLWHEGESVIISSFIGGANDKLKRLEAMMENKKKRSKHFTPELMTEYWIEVVKNLRKK